MSADLFHELILEIDSHATGQGEMSGRIFDEDLVRLASARLSPRQLLRLCKLGLAPEWDHVLELQIWLKHIRCAYDDAVKHNETDLETSATGQGSVSRGGAYRYIVRTENIK